MCVAELNVSLQPCQHRWYHLLRPCIPGGNLVSCPGKLAIEGWETRCEYCPYCAGSPDIDNGELLLFGGHPNSRNRSASLNTPLSRTPSLSTTVNVARRDSRRGSASSNTSTSSGNYAAPAALGSPVHVAGTRNRAMNSRVDSYLDCLPENMLESQKRLTRADGEDDEALRRGSASTTSSASAPAKEPARKPSKAWRKSMSGGKGMMSFFR